MGKKDETIAPKATLEDKPIQIVVDQDGVFLRVQDNETVLEEGVHFELFEEIVVKAESDATPSDPGTPNTEVVVKNSVCAECKGSGLKNSETMCTNCNGSGKVE